ncbi:unnamed protein product [Soboliphyme baturini]|uniref:Secreted protein n=1 Tax=Soboliphyme baturini TaxID=241478 RepID=A0A183ILV3_9BILA|nr:unnamed protein product [Soboliphyme baturini]
MTCRLTKSLCAATLGLLLVVARPVNGIGVPASLAQTLRDTFGAGGGSASKDNLTRHIASWASMAGGEDSVHKIEKILNLIEHKPDEGKREH